MGEKKMEIKMAHQVELMLRKKMKLPPPEINLLLEYLKLDQVLHTWIKE